MKIGLVLSGGGGKGAYELGCWKAFNEMGISFDAISGSSIGAINGLLMSVGTLDSSIQLWHSIAHQLANSKMSEVSIITPEDIDKMNACFSHPEYLQEVKKVKGKLSTQPLYQLLENVLTEETLQNVQNELYICAVSDEKLPKAKYFNIHSMALDDAKKAIVSSAALPYIFDGQEIDHTYYYDGGILDVTPIQPLSDINCDVIFVIYLKNSIPLNFDSLKPSTIIPIVPSKDLGDFLYGTMDFSLEGIQWRSELGYEDTMKVLHQIKNLL